MTDLLDAFNFDQAYTAVSEVASSIFWIVMAIIAMEAFLYLAVMARKTSGRIVPIAAATPIVVIVAAFLW